MFDNPKKELERLQEQLLAAEAGAEEEYDTLSDDYCSDSDADNILDDSLYAALYDDQTISRRSAGFDIPDDPYEMESDRYVPAPKKKGIGGLLFIAFLEILLAGALIAWWLGWLG